MRFAIDLEDVPDEIEADDYDDARGKVNSLISIQEIEGDNK